MKIIIWGTGTYSVLAQNYIDRVNRQYDGGLFSVIGFVDSSQNKIGTEFSGHVVQDPNVIFGIQNDTVVLIAVKEDKEIQDRCINEYACKFFRFVDFVVRERALLYISKTHHDLNLPEEIVAKLEKKDKFANLVSNQYSYADISQTIGCDCAVAALFSEYRGGITAADNFVSEKSAFSKQRTQIKTIALYYHRYYNGGIERVMSYLMSIYSDSGYNVILITEESKGKEKEYEVNNDVKRFTLPNYIEDQYMWIIRLAKLLDDNNVDILCNHDYIEDRNYYMGLLAYQKRITFITQIHNYYQPFINQYKKDFEILYKFNDCLIVLSEKDRNYWNSRGIKARYIPNPVALPRDSSSKKYDMMDNKTKTILWIGRISVLQKNVYDVVDVMKTLKTMVLGIKLNIVGAADDIEVLAELKRRIEQNDLMDTIELCGYHTDVGSYYKEADVMMVTSSYEGFLMTLAEAMGYGVPTVLYDMPYLELLKPHKGYIAVEQRDTKAMAGEIMRVLSDRELYDKLSEEALENVRAFASIDIAGEWEKVFHGCYR